MGKITKNDLIIKVVALHEVANRLYENGTAPTVHWAMTKTIDEAGKVASRLARGVRESLQFYELESMEDGLLYFNEYWIDLVHKEALLENVDRDAATTAQKAAATNSVNADLASTKEGRAQLANVREMYRNRYKEALHAKRAGITVSDAQAEMEFCRECMDAIDAARREAKLAVTGFRLLSKMVTGNFFLTYYDPAKGQSIYDVKMTLEETFRHINREGWPSNIKAELVGGGLTFARLHMASAWDYDYACHWYYIYTMSGTELAQEYLIEE